MDPPLSRDYSQRESSPQPPGGFPPAEQHIPLSFLNGSPMNAEFFEDFVPSPPKWAYVDLMALIACVYSLFASVSWRRRGHRSESTSGHTTVFNIISPLLFGLPHQSALGLACNADGLGSWGSYVSVVTKKWRTSMTFSMVLLSLNMCLLLLQDTQIPPSLPPSALISMALAIAAYVLSQNLVLAYSGTVKGQWNVQGRIDQKDAASFGAAGLMVAIPLALTLWSFLFLSFAAAYLTVGFMSPMMRCIAGLVLSITFVNLVVISNLGLAMRCASLGNPDTPHNVFASPDNGNLTRPCRKKTSEDMTLAELLVCHFSGSNAPNLLGGHYVPEKNQSNASCTVDATKPLPTSHPPSCMMEDDTFKGSLAIPVPSSTQLIAFFDSCHSATFSDGQYRLMSHASNHSAKKFPGMYTCQNACLAFCQSPVVIDRSGIDNSRPMEGHFCEVNREIPLEIWSRTTNTTGPTKFEPGGITPSDIAFIAWFLGNQTNAPFMESRPRTLKTFPPSQFM